MNIVRVREPRWSTHDVLVRSWDLADENLVVITDVKDGSVRRYQPLAITKAELMKYPRDFIRSREGKLNVFYAVPLSKFQKTTAHKDQASLLELV